MTSTALDTVMQYHRAWTTNDMDTAMSLVADDIRCRAPGGDIDGKAQYQEFIGAMALMLTGIDDIATFPSGTAADGGERVALFYCPQTAETSTTVAGECFTVRDGRIVETVLAFDRRSYEPADAS